MSQPAAPKVRWAPSVERKQRRPLASPDLKPACPFSLQAFYPFLWVGLARKRFSWDIGALLSGGWGGGGVKPPGAIGCRDLGDGHAQALLKP